jgi:hypothetical protein
MSSLCLLLVPHLTTYDSNIGVQMIAVLELGVSTLCGFYMHQLLFYMFGTTLDPNYVIT